MSILVYVQKKKNYLHVRQLNKDYSDQLTQPLVKLYFNV